MDIYFFMGSKVESRKSKVEANPPAQKAAGAAPNKDRAAELTVLSRS
jgi:hypothetical protein